MNGALFSSLATGACSLGAEGGFGPDRIVRTVYDLAGQATQVRTAVGTADEAAEVTTTYTDNGLVETVTDAENNKTTYVHDAFDRLSQVRYPSATRGSGTSNGSDYEQLGYDSGSNVTSFRNRANETIGYAYDALGRMTAKDRPGGELDVAYGYDLLGQLTSAATSAQTLAFAYDALGRNLSQSDGSRVYSSQYDLAGRRTRITHPDGFYVDQDYLVTGETTRIRENGATSGVGLLATYAYDDLGRRTLLTLGNGAVTDYGYDAVSRLSTLVHDLAGSTYDNTVTFTYNPASQIVSTTRSNDLYAWTGHGSGTTSTTADGLNRIPSWNSTLSWDAKGNMTYDGSKTYTYDSENRAATTNGFAYYYDPLGRLAGAGSPLAISYENYVDGLIAERTPGNSSVSRRHVFGPGVDEPIVWYEGSGTSDRRFLSADERGSIVAVSDGTGAVRNVNRYDENGRVQHTDPYYLARFAFTGQRYFSGNGIYYYKSRLYDPKSGRFMQPDPIGYDGGMNLYAYVGGDPVNFTDPAGLKKCDRTTDDGAPVVCGGGSDGPMFMGAAAALGGSSGNGSGQGVGGGGGGGWGGEIVDRNPTAEEAAECEADHVNCAIVDGPKKQQIIIGIMPVPQMRIRGTLGNRIVYPPRPKPTRATTVDKSEEIRLLKAQDAARRLGERKRKAGKWPGWVNDFLEWLGQMSS